MADKIPSTENTDSDPLWNEVERVRASAYALGKNLREIHAAAVAVIIALVNREGDRLPAYLSARGVESGDNPERALIAYMGNGLKANRLSEITAVVKRAQREGVTDEAAGGWLRDGGGVDGLYKSDPTKRQTTPRKQPCSAKPMEASQPAPQAAEPPSPVESVTETTSGRPPEPAGLNPLEPIFTGSLLPRLDLSDKKKERGRELVERAFHARNSISDTINSVRAYHRIIGDWSPSDLGIGRYDNQISKLQDAVNDALHGSKIRFDENIELKSRIRELERQLRDQSRQYQSRIRELEAEVAALKRKPRRNAA